MIDERADVVDELRAFGDQALADRVVGRFVRYDLRRIADALLVPGFTDFGWDHPETLAASIPADQQAWEKLLQKYLGGYYFPIYLKGRLQGKYTLENPGDWGFVPDNPALPRILLIGDSILNGYLKRVTVLLEGKAYVDAWVNPYCQSGHLNKLLADAPDLADLSIEELITTLSQVPGLRVAARTSSFQFKGQNPDVHEVGRKLDVGAVLEGSVRKSGSRLRVSAQLINVKDGYQLWSES